MIDIVKEKAKEKIPIECPACRARLVISKYEKTLEKAVKAVKDTWYEVEKDKQSKLPKAGKKA